MKAFKEIGTKKLLRFFVFTLLMLLFKLAIFPPLRSLFLKALGARIGKNTILHNVKFFNIYRTGFKGFVIGDSCFIGDEVLFDLADKIIIEDQVTFAERVTVLTHTNVGFKDHPLQRYFPAFTKPVIFKRDCFIGTNVTILPGVTIGECSFIAAGCVVTKDVPPKVVVGGVPGRVIREIK